MRRAVAFLAALLATSAVHAQFGGGNRNFEYRGGVPEWDVDARFKHDVFTFARVMYSTGGGVWRDDFRSGRRGRRGGRGGSWRTDYPDAELNLSFRLQQMTSLKVNPEAAVVQLTDENLTTFPFLYIVEPGRLLFSDEEVTALREYLLNGGFLMVDDFWGVNEWLNIEREMQRVFPDRQIVDLPIEHPVFHCVFELNEKPQVPGISAFENGLSYERPDASDVHYYAYFDDKDRMVAIICRNTDLGDGWEREGYDAAYFRKYAEPMAYPMAINIIFYAMTH